MTRIIRLIAAAVAALSPTLAVAEDRPLALVEHISGAPDAGVLAFDYVYEGDKIDLRPGGELRIAYFDNCKVLTITGGLVKLKDDRAKISKGGAGKLDDRPCQTASLSLDAKAREAGVAVKRVTPFPEEEWKEITVATATPRFVWPRTDNDSSASIEIYYLDAEPADLTWQSKTNSNQVVYPDDAPSLKPGMPYEIIVSYNGKPHVAGVFSIDYGLELPDSPLTTTVPLGL
ncbi:MAG: hypothetical protein HKN14_08810 [Marinicaulis sp.]|nr:hypothetical protein [Marinicaulis sp.]NNL89025.1 hypothetical protein [Marinicaulis sp.]